jgi:hypothetical protein
MLHAQIADALEAKFGTVTEKAAPKQGAAPKATKKEAPASFTMKTAAEDGGFYGIVFKNGMEVERTVKATNRTTAINHGKKLLKKFL